MTQINGINVDFLMNEDPKKVCMAVYTVEFDYDYKVLIHHTPVGTSVFESVKLFIKNIVRSPGKHKRYDLYAAILYSDKLCVSIEKANCTSAMEMLRFKYDLVVSKKTYLPTIGYNSLATPNILFDKYEKQYANEVCVKIIYTILHNSRAFERVYINEKRPNSRKVYCYNKTTGEFIAEYASVKEAVLKFKVSQSSISSCCTGHTRSAGGYIWSYTKTDKII